MNGMETRICKRCLIRDSDWTMEKEKFEHYLEAIDEEQKADSQLYQQRLATCLKCDKLMNGMCRLCGCFVEMRAAMKKNVCPEIKAKW